MAALRALNHCAGVRHKGVGAAAAPVALRDRRQHLSEAPLLAVGLELLERDETTGFVDVGLEHFRGITQAPITIIIGGSN